MSLPSFPESEDAVIGTVLLDPPGKGREFASVLTASHFVSLGNNFIAEAILSIVMRNEDPDIVAIIAQLQVDGVKSVDTSRLTELAHNANPLSWRVTVARLQQALSLRKLIAAASSAIARAGALEDPERVVADLAGALVAISVKGPDTTRGLDTIMEEVRVGLAHRRMLEPKPSGCLFGVDRLDWLTTGVKPGRLCVIAGATGGGKTSLAMQGAFRFSLSGGYVLVFNLEMTSAELCERAIAHAELLDSADLALGQITKEQWGKIDERITEMKQRSVMIEDRLRNTADICARARAWRCRNADKPGLVVVDFLQLLRGANPKDQRYRQVGETAEDFKALAKELNVAVLLLSQLSRTMDPRQPPTLSRLKESGDIENAADIVICGHNPDKVLDGEMSLFVLKNRAGRTGEAAAHFIGRHFMFRDAGDTF